MLRKIVIGWGLIAGMIFYTFAVGAVGLYSRVRQFARKDATMEPVPDERKTDKGL